MAAPVQYIISYSWALQLIRSVETFHNSISVHRIYYTDRKIYFFWKKKEEAEYSLCNTCQHNASGWFLRYCSWQDVLVGCYRVTRWKFTSLIQKMIFTPVALTLKHSASNRKAMGLIPRECRNYIYVSWIHCKLLWIKESVKCIHVMWCNVSVLATQLIFHLSLGMSVSC